MIDLHRPDRQELLPPEVALLCQTWVEGGMSDALEASCPGARLVSARLCPPHQRADALCAEIRAFFQIPTRTLLGLPAFRDTLEGAFDTPHGQVLWCAHEVQKGVRLLLRQSHASLEMLGGLELWSEEEGLEGLLRRGVTSQAPRTYRDMASGLAARAIEGDEESRWPAIRHALTGLRLATEANLTIHSPALVDWSVEVFGDPGGEDFEVHIESLLGRLDEAIARSALPARPESYEALSDWLVGLRLAGVSSC